MHPIFSVFTSTTMSAHCHQHSSTMLPIWISSTHTSIIIHEIQQRDAQHGTTSSWPQSVPTYLLSLYLLNVAPNKGLLHVWHHTAKGRCLHVKWEYIIHVCGSIYQWTSSALYRLQFRGRV
jgi:hypothetical protein